MKEPTLTLTQLENRLTELQQAEQKAEANAQQAQANVHAFQGAIAETQNWIKQLEESAIPKAGDLKVPNGSGDGRMTTAPAKK
jgi:peptidoglycan hydrolase CwlO-like protein